MTIQNITLGSAPTGAGGDTFRSAATKIQSNFSTTENAASRIVGTASGNVMPVGAFGLGGAGAEVYNIDDKRGASCSFKSHISGQSPAGAGYGYGLYIDLAGRGWGGQIYMPAVASQSPRFRATAGDTYGAFNSFLTSINTTVDSNGFIKNASPIIQLFADKIEANTEAKEQEPIFEKVDIGHYLIKNTEGFAQESWWIQVPTDTNGNKICAVEYQTLGNGDLEVKTFKKKLNEEGDIVANLDKPIDIPDNANGEPRWIDIRLHSSPKPIIARIPRTEKQPKLIQQMKYAPQLVYIVSEEDMKDDDEKVVVVGGQVQKIQKPYIRTDANGTPVLQDQPVIDENGRVVFEWVQALDSNGEPIFEDVPALDEQGNQIIDEVVYEPE